MTKIKNFDEFLDEGSYWSGYGDFPEQLSNNSSFLKDIEKLQSVEDLGNKRMDLVYKAQDDWEKRKKAIERKYDITIGYNWGDVLA